MHWGNGMEKESADLNFCHMPLFEALMAVCCCSFSVRTELERCRTVKDREMQLCVPEERTALEPRHISQAAEILCVYTHTHTHALGAHH